MLPCSLLAVPAQTLKVQQHIANWQVLRLRQVCRLCSLPRLVAPHRLTASGLAATPRVGLAASNVLGEEYRFSQHAVATAVTAPAQILFEALLGLWYDEKPAEARHLAEALQNAW